MYKGPQKFREIWFDGFQNNGVYDIVAIALFRKTPYFFPMVNQLSDLLFAFNDSPEVRMMVRVLKLAVSNSDGASTV